MSTKRRNIDLLLLRTIENLGIVGDIVNVRPGFARNYLLPHGLAEHPTPEKIESLKEARAEALAEVAAERRQREALIERMSEVTVSVKRSCNDQGLLYGSITQRDIADALAEAGYGVEVRAVRLTSTMRRIGSYTVPIQLDKDLRCEITINILPDRELEDQIRAADEQAASEDDTSSEPNETEKSETEAPAPTA